MEVSHIQSNQNNQNSNWKKILWFGNMQEKLEKRLALLRRASFFKVVHVEEFQAQICSIFGQKMIFWNEIIQRNITKLFFLFCNYTNSLLNTTFGSGKKFCGLNFMSTKFEVTRRSLGHHLLHLQILSLLVLLKPLDFEVQSSLL